MTPKNWYWQQIRARCSLCSATAQIKHSRYTVRSQMKDLQTFGAAPTTVAVKKAPPPPKPQSVYEVETYDGTKKNTVKF